MKKPFKQTLRGILLLSAMMLVTLSAQARIPFAVDGQEIPSLAPMLERVMPAVVNISTITNIRVRSANPFFDDPFFRRYFNVPQPSQRNQKRQGLGSGVIINAEQGLIITNSHVIDQVDEINVALKDGREYKAVLIGSDKDTDVAVIKIVADGLTEVALGDSDKLRVGDFVVAIGNPFGLRQTVTSGIVSALGRSGLGIEGYEDFIQTDAPINPGNSGGALVNLRGELVGINTAIIAPSGGSVGINFAIPMNMVQQLQTQLVEFGEVQRGHLGVQVQDLTPILAQGLQTTQMKGAVIAEVDQGSAAENAGLQSGDIVVSINQKIMENAAQFRNQIGLVRIGEEVVVDIVRDNEPLTITARMGNVEVDSRVGERLNARLDGATFSEMTDQKRSTSSGGVLVNKVEPNSSAWFYGLREGDVIQSVNKQVVTDLKSFRAALKIKDMILLNVIRNGSSLFMLLQ